MINKYVPLSALLVVFAWSATAIAADEGRKNVRTDVEAAKRQIKPPPVVAPGT